MKNSWLLWVVGGLGVAAVVMGDSSAAATPSVGSSSGSPPPPPPPPSGGSSWTPSGGSTGAQPPGPGGSSSGAAKTPGGASGGLTKAPNPIIDGVLHVQPGGSFKPAEAPPPEWAGPWPNVYRAASFVGGSLYERARVVFAGLIRRYDGNLNFMDVHTRPNAKPTSREEIASIADELEVHWNLGGLGSDVLKLGIAEARFAAANFAG